MPPETCLRQEIAELLPWYVNETLGEEERQRVEAHMQECAICRQEVEMLRRVAATVQAEHPVPRADLYARTVTRLEPRGLGRFAQYWRRVVLQIPSYARVAMAAQLAVIIALVVAVVRPQAYTTLSGPEGPSGPVARLQVIFADATTAVQIRDALIPMRARIVDGPSSLGVYRVEVSLGNDAVVKSADDALRRLRAFPFVEFAEIVEERRQR